MYKKRFFCFLSLVLFTVLSVMGQGLENFKLNEVVINNTKGLVDEYGERSAWIEVANTSWSSTDLSGCYITNDPSVLNENLTAPERIAKMSLIPKGDARTELAPKGHLVFFADGKANLGTLHTNFVLLPGQKAFIALYEGNGVKMIDSVSVPANLPANTSWARFYDSKSDGYVWMNCESTKVTPNSANDNTAKKEDKVAEFKAKDPHGIAMTILGMGIVFFGLILLCVFFNIFGYVARKLSRKNNDVSKSEMTLTASVIPSTPKPADDDMAVYMTVIAMALYELEQDAHDEESNVITIVPKTSPWSSHELEMTKLPQK